MFLIILSPGPGNGQGVVQNPVCYGTPVQLLCNFSAGCSNPEATFTWSTSSGTWITHDRDPILYPPGSQYIGSGQTANGSGLCRGEGYASGVFSLTINYAPPPGGYYHGTLTVSINSTAAAGVSIATSTNPACEGSQVTFRATPTNGGTTPIYEWSINGMYSPPDSTGPTFNCYPQNHDTIRCRMTSGNSCASGSPALSNKVIMTLNSTYYLSGYAVDAQYGGPIWSGIAYLLSTSHTTGGYDTISSSYVGAGYFSIPTCGTNACKLLIRPLGNDEWNHIPTYLGDVIFWNSATTLNLSAATDVDTIIVQNTPPIITMGQGAYIKGIVYRLPTLYGKANDPIDNVGVTIKPKTSSAIIGYGESDPDGDFDLGTYGTSNYTVMADYPGIPVYTQGGANNVVVYNEYDSVNLEIRVSPDYVRVYASYVVTPSCTVDNSKVSGNEQRCFNALQDLEVAGDMQKPVTVYSGGTGYFVSGQKIRFLPGFKVNSGGFIWAHITTSEQYCDQLMSPVNSLGNTVIGPGQNRCFQAINTLMTGGTGASFLLLSGGVSHLIAGENIRMLPSTQAKSGSSLHAYITTNGSYCNNPKEGEAVNTENETAQNEILTDPKTFFRIYPNPTSGSFTLEILSDPAGSPVTLTCVNPVGRPILERTFHSGKKYELSLEGQAPGLYLIHAVMNGATGIRKLILQK
ncbi:MAG TPA: T9SS type A sorting domain-containing protein [Bacteroidales bacterium]|nr:T9SS type A sorting domain-containing protein [Bacteroidales bacterium]